MGFRLGVIGFHAKSSTRDISQQNSQPCKLILHAEKLLPEMRSEARTASPHCRHYCARLHWIFPPPNPPAKHGFLIISQEQVLFQCLSSFDKMLHKCDQLTNCVNEYCRSCASCFSGNRTTHPRVFNIKSDVC